MSWTLLEKASYSCLQILGFLGDRFPEINRRMLLMSLDFGLFRGFSSWLIGSARVIDGDVMVKRLSIHVMSSSSLIDMSFVDSGAGIVEMSWVFLNKPVTLVFRSWAFSGLFSWLIGSARVIDGDVMVKRLSIHVMSSSSLIDMSFVDSGAGIVEMSWALFEQASYSCLQILGFLGDGFPEINRRMLLMSLDFGMLRGFSSWLIGSARVIDGDVMVKRLSIHVMSSSSLIDMSFVDSGAGIVEVSWIS
ncbi:hypothetical protein L596_029386 [Steinernema carpocapsae]|uniref:Uncharacterized protein n=1 Tax=Steinernema carpocapsae TaxID=34508 RepID=A0A4U5LUH4_STECR|nr:hypothetical protein L596_029386 [Steinernema carpocapsae]